MPNLFPEDMVFEETNTGEMEESLEFKGSYLFDFEKWEFVKNLDGSIAKCNDIQAYVQWCYKAMLTPRYKLAYSDLYGQDFKTLIGSGLSKSAIELEIKRITREALMVHPRTRDVNNFIFQWPDSKNEVYYTYEVTTIDQEEITLNQTVKLG